MNKKNLEKENNNFELSELFFIFDFILLIKNNVKKIIIFVIFCLFLNNIIYFFIQNLYEDKYIFSYNYFQNDFFDIKSHNFNYFDVNSIEEKFFDHLLDLNIVKRAYLESDQLKDDLTFIELTDIRNNIEVYDLKKFSGGKVLKKRGMNIVYESNDLNSGTIFIPNIINNILLKLENNFITQLDMKIKLLNDRISNFQDLSRNTTSSKSKDLAEIYKDRSEEKNILNFMILEIENEKKLLKQMINFENIENISKTLKITKEKDINNRYLRPISIGISNILIFALSLFVAIIYLAINASYIRWKQR